jgi:hypothetical protein
VETVVRGARELPRVRCTDGDPSCDADPSADRCGFTLGWCLNNADPRLACTARGLRRAAIGSAELGRLAARALRAGAMAAIAGASGGGAVLRGPAVLFAPLYTAENTCTREVTVAVAVRRRGTRRRPGRALVTTIATGRGRLRDVDRIRLFCDPAPTRPSSIPPSSAPDVGCDGLHRRRESPAEWMME